MRRVICTCDRCGKELTECTNRFVGETIEIVSEDILPDVWDPKIDLCPECYTDVEREIVKLVFDPKGIKSAAAKIMEKEEKMSKAERNKWVMDLVKEGHSYDYVAKEVGVSKATVGSVVKKMREENNDAD